MYNKHRVIQEFEKDMLDMLFNTLIGTSALGIMWIFLLIFIIV